MILSHPAVQVCRNVFSCKRATRGLDNYNKTDPTGLSKMTSRPSTHGLKQRYTIAMAALAAVAVLGTAALLYLRATGLLGGAAFGWTLIVLLGAAFGAALALVAGLADRFGRPLRAVTAALADAARGDYQTPIRDDDFAELRELTGAVESMRMSLRSSTISRDYLDRLLASMGEALLITDADGKIERANTAAQEMFGDRESELTGRLAHELIISNDRRQANGPASRPREGAVLRPDGSKVSISYTESEVRNDRGALEGKVYAARNIDERKRVEQRIRYLARTDPLTKIANRMQFQHLLQQGIARARRTQTYLAILYMDVDRFKDINDTFGHAAGDTSLEIFSRRVLGELAENAHFWPSRRRRIRGVADGLRTNGRTPQRARRVRHQASTSHRQTVPSSRRRDFSDDRASASPSIRATATTSSISCATRDAALYQAKKAGGNCLEFYSTEMNTAAVERLMLKSKLRRAFERDELRLHYQPKYRLKTAGLEGAEALVRWDLPERGLVFPSDFMPLAEETNLILQLGDWVLNRVCADYRYLATLGTFAVPRLDEFVASATAATSISRSRSRDVSGRTASLRRHSSSRSPRRR